MFTLILTVSMSVDQTHVTILPVATISSAPWGQVVLVYSLSSIECFHLTSHVPQLLPGAVCQYQEGPTCLSTIHTTAPEGPLGSAKFHRSLVTLYPGWFIDDNHTAVVTMSTVTPLQWPCCGSSNTTAVAWIPQLIVWSLWLL